MRRVVTGKQEMVAVVDPAAEVRILVGSATAAGVRGGFVHNHGTTGSGEPNRRSQTCEPRADYVHPAGG